MLVILAAGTRILITFAHLSRCFLTTLKGDDYFKRACVGDTVALVESDGSLLMTSSLVRVALIHVKGLILAIIEMILGMCVYQILHSLPRVDKQVIWLQGILIPSTLHNVVDTHVSAKEQAGLPLKISSHAMLVLTPVLDKILAELPAMPEITAHQITRQLLSPPLLKIFGDKLVLLLSL